MSGTRLSVRLPKPDRAHLCQRSDRFCDASLDRFNASDKRGADRAKADEQYAELAFGSSICGFFFDIMLPFLESRFLQRSFCDACI